MTFGNVFSFSVTLVDSPNPYPKSAIRTYAHTRPPTPTCARPFTERVHVSWKGECAPLHMYIRTFWEERNPHNCHVDNETIVCRKPHVFSYVTCSHFIYTKYANHTRCSANWINSCNLSRFLEWYAQRVFHTSKSSVYTTPKMQQFSSVSFH